jgi:hypothetical protein
MSISGDRKIVINDINHRPRPLVRDGASLEIRAELVVHELDPRELGRGPIAAIRDLLRRQIKAISVAASPATIARRARALRAAKEGHPVEVRRYSGVSPDNTGQLFRDSGALADQLEVQQGKDGAWEIATDRIDPTQFTPTALERFWQRLASLVPALRGEALDDPKVQEAVIEAHKDAVYVVRNGRRVPR